MIEAPTIKSTRIKPFRFKSAERRPLPINGESQPFIYLKSFPGLRPDILDSFLDNGMKALVLEGFHSGTIHACSRIEEPDCDSNLVPFLDRARTNRVPVFMTFGDFPYLENEDLKYNFKAFDNLEGLYGSSARAINAGIVPLHATDRQMYEVTAKLEEALRYADDYDVIIDIMYGAFPFAVSLDQIRNFCSHAMRSDR